MYEREKKRKIKKKNKREEGKGNRDRRVKKILFRAQSGGTVAAMIIPGDRAFRSIASDLTDGFPIAPRWKNNRA